MPGAQRADVLVVGAGPTGLALALTLVRSGVVPRLVDARPAPTPQSRALDVQARTLELYASLGVAEAVVRAGVRIETVEVRDGGRRVAAVDVRGLGRGLSRYPFLLCCPQDDHERVLREALAAAGCRVGWGTALTGLRPRPDGVVATLTGPDGVPEDVTAGYVAGCDGARSRVRDALGVPFPGHTLDQPYFVADVTTAGRPREDAAFRFCLHEEDFVLAVPARRTGTTRLIGLVPRAVADREHVDFADLRETVERATGLPVEAVHWVSTYRVASRLADRYRQGRVFLLGDAAHLHSPLGGQGMNTGVADAVNLGWRLAAAVVGRAATGLLDGYEAERRPVARRLVRTTDRAFRLLSGPGRRPRLTRRALFGVLLPVVLRLPGVRSAAARTVAEVDVGYRSGPLSAGRAGRVRGGDRLPFVNLGDGRDNHIPLASLDWQVHVYGTARPALRAAAGDWGLPLHVVPWTSRARRAGLRRDAVYLVRPDGHVAVADRRQRPERLRPVLAAVGRSAPSAAAVAPGG